MMNTTLTVDKAGRVVLPKPVRDELQLPPGILSELESSEDRIVLARAGVERTAQETWNLGLQRRRTSPGRDCSSNDKGRSAGNVIAAKSAPPSEVSDRWRAASPAVRGSPRPRLDPVSCEDHEHDQLSLSAFRPAEKKRPAALPTARQKSRWPESFARKAPLERGQVPLSWNP